LFIKLEGSSIAPPEVESRWLKPAPLWFWTAASFIQELMSVGRSRGNPSADATRRQRCATGIQYSTLKEGLWRVARRRKRDGQARLEACRDGSRDAVDVKEAEQRRRQCDQHPAINGLNDDYQRARQYLPDVTRHLHNPRPRRRNGKKVLPKHALSC